MRTWYGEDETGLLSHQVYTRRRSLDEQPVLATKP
jgi:hypothetical protein